MFSLDGTGVVNMLTYAALSKRSFTYRGRGMGIFLFLAFIVEKKERKNERVKLTSLQQRTSRLAVFEAIPQNCNMECHWYITCTSSWYTTISAINKTRTCAVRVPNSAGMFKIFSTPWSPSLGVKWRDSLGGACFLYNRGLL